MRNFNILKEVSDIWVADVRDGVRGLVGGGIFMDYEQLLTF